MSELTYLIRIVTIVYNIEFSNTYQTEEKGTWPDVRISEGKFVDPKL